MQGVVVAVCSSPHGGVPKFVRDGVTFTPLGVAGDHHATATRFDRKAGGHVPNMRSVTVMGQEAYDAFNPELGTSLKAGDFGENVLTQGLGDLSDLVAGDRLRLDAADGGHVELLVTDQNEPCKMLLPYHRHMVKAAWRKQDDGSIVKRRGVLCVVAGVEGTGEVGVGAAVTLAPLVV